VDELELQLCLGRAPGLTAQRLRVALERLGAGGAGPAVPAGPAGTAGTAGTAATAGPAATSELSEPAALIGLPRSQLEALGLSPAASAALAVPDAARIAADRAAVERERITVIGAGSPAYPPLLAQIADAPAVLYVRGDPAALAAPQLAMVGSRSPTASGRRTAQAFAAFLAQAGLTITSGLAVGIDAASHEGALRGGGHTVAVLGSGLMHIYPPEHLALAERIGDRGALLSEFPPDTPPLRENFPRRNRLISGLALGTLVVEATRRSGSLITARQAADQGREVFAIPGSIHNPLAAGCHDLIKSGAKLVERGQDVLDEIRFQSVPQGLTAARKEPPRAAQTQRMLDKEYKILLDALGFEPGSIDSLVERSGLASQAVASMLLILELEGAVGLQPDGRYVRLPDS
jgi:DNA processing protein